MDVHAVMKRLIDRCFVKEQQSLSCFLTLGKMGLHNYLVRHQLHTPALQQRLAEIDMQ